MTSAQPPGLPSISVGDLPDPLPDGVAVLDVREPVEWQHGHVAGAVHLPLAELPGRLADVPDGQVLVVCRVGARSAQAVMWLAQQGHDAVNLRGGLLEWEAAGRALVSDGEGEPTIV